MLTHPTLDLLHDLGLHGMSKGFRDMADNPESAALGHAEWLGILLERESTLRQQKRFESRAKTAKLRHQAAVEPGTGEPVPKWNRLQRPTEDTTRLQLSEAGPSFFACDLR